jgi:S-DNA-T family DNA segregation ATPase FtsK/SpoIIIE
VSTVIIKRPPRQPSPELPSGEVILEPPPEAPQATGKGWSRMMMIMPMAAGAAGMGLMMGGQRGGPLAYVAGGMYGVSILGMIAAQLTSSGGQSKSDMIEARRQYMRKLSRLRTGVRNTIRQQREAMFYRHPDPGALWSTAASARLWERRRTDGDFAVVRIGLGPQELATPLVPPQTRPVDELEPLCATALRRFVTTYSIVPDLPVAMALRGFSRVHVTAPVPSPDDAVRAMIRALLAQLTTFHAPDDVLVAFCVSDERRAHWEWAKWLPHALHPGKTDAVGRVRLVAPTVTALEAMLDDVLASRSRFNPAAPPSDGLHLVVVIDGGDTMGSDHLMTEGGVEGVTLLDISNPPPRILDQSTIVLTIAGDGTMSSTTMDGTAVIGPADALDLVQAEALVRQLSPLRLSAISVGDQPLTGELGLAELLDVGDPYEFDLAKTWAARPNRDRLRVPIGVGPDGRPVELDLKESAQEGMGPHGLLVGATGSGKSELLRTLVLALAITHNSEILNFVLVDFKGGATFATLDRLPHTSAVITNLADDLALVDRMLDAISGELMRRQELLRQAGNYDSQRDYERARAAGVPLVPLPSLLIVCDEFSELLSAKPDFIDMFVQIGRVGRSLGVHLLLASQRLEEGRLRGLDTHLSYRVGLRTFSSMESRSVLGVPDAYELPRSPGHGYLKTGTESLVRFKAAYVSGTYRRGVSSRQGGDGRQGAQIHPYSTWYQAPRVDPEAEAAPEAKPEDDILGQTLLSVMVERLENAGVPAHQVWLPPLSEPPTLDQLLPALEVVEHRGLTTSGQDLLGALQGFVGIVDQPYQQRRDLLRLDLAGAAGSVVVVGGPQSGKSTLVRTLLASLALSHTPTEAQFYCLDFGGGSLTALRDLPHVGGVATRRDVNHVRRTIAELQTLLATREQVFAANGIDGMTTYRRLKREGQFAEDQFGDAFLVVDGWLSLRQEFEDLEPVVTDLANRGLSYGIHLIGTCGRWMDLRPAARDSFGTKLELRLGDPADSAIHRQTAVNVPERTPGRGLTPNALHFLAGLPRIDGQQDPDNLSDGVSKMVQAVRNEWSGEPAPRVRLLPAQLPYQALPMARHGEAGLPIGIAESDLQPVYVDFRTEPHFLLFGDVECGKSTFLRSLARAITDRHRPAEARIMLVDYRRSLLGSIETEHLIGYGSSGEVTTGLIDQVLTVMRERLPGPDVTPDQLRNRSWWKGPDLYLLVDDYDLVATGPVNPLAPLLDFLAQGRDIGLHLIVTRRVGGASRAMFDPVISRIRDLASPGMVMSGPRDEGALIGTVKPQALPPGRGWLVTRRGGAQLVQLAWLPPV